MTKKQKKMLWRILVSAALLAAAALLDLEGPVPVSYTHLTLPTIRLV